MNRSIKYPFVKGSISLSKKTLDGLSIASVDWSNVGGLPSRSDHQLHFFFLVKGELSVEGG